MFPKIFFLLKSYYTHFNISFSKEQSHQTYVNNSQNIALFVLFTTTLG